MFITLACYLSIAITSTDLARIEHIMKSLSYLLSALFQTLQPAGVDVLTQTLSDALLQVFAFMTTELSTD